MQDPAEIPTLIGVDGIAELVQVSPNTAYSWAARGQLGEPDVKLSRRSMWYRDRWPEQITLELLDSTIGPRRGSRTPVRQPVKLADVSERPLYPVVLLGPAEVATAFHVGLRTVETWRQRARDLLPTDPLRTPEPRFYVSSTAFWVGADWCPYAEARGIRFALPSLDAWHKTQRPEPSHDEWDQAQDPIP